MGRSPSPSSAWGAAAPPRSKFPFAQSLFGLVFRLTSGSGGRGINLSGSETHPGGSVSNPSTIQVKRSMPSGPTFKSNPSVLHRSIITIIRFAGQFHPNV